jgi:hypothetical protein
MKTFNRTSLPEYVTYNGMCYKCDFKASGAICGKKVFDLELLGLKYKKVVAVNVLSKNLKGKTDLYGQPYRPTTWIFVGRGY